MWYPIGSSIQISWQQCHAALHAKWPPDPLLPTARAEWHWLELRCVFWQPHGAKQEAQIFLNHNKFLILGRRLAVEGVKNMHSPTKRKRPRSMGGALQQSLITGQEIWKTWTKIGSRPSSWAETFTRPARSSVAMNYSSGEMVFHDKKRGCPSCTNWHWVLGSVKLSEPVAQVRNYFGERIALYFLFMQGALPSETVPDNGPFRCDVCSMCQSVDI